MKLSRILIPLVVVMSAYGFGLVPSAFGQARKAASPSNVLPTGGGKGDNVSVKKVGDLGSIGRVRTPEYTSDASENKKGTVKEWARIWVQYATHEEWTDELKLKFYVLLKNPKDNKNPYTIFTGETSECDIPKGKEHLTTMFIHPNTFLRYGDVDRIAVEACGPSDEILSFGANPEDPNKWWRTTDKVRIIKDGLLTRAQTPFAFVAYDNYERVKAAK